MRDRIHALQTIQIIARSVFERRIGVFSEVHANDALITRGPNALNSCIDAAVVKPHPLNQRARIRQTEQARTRLAALCARPYRAHIEKTETQRRQSVDTETVFVESGGKSNRIVKTQSHHRAWRVNGRCL